MTEKRLQLIQRIRELRKQGYTIKEISYELNRSYNSIAYFVRTYNLYKNRDFPPYIIDVLKNNDVKASAQILNRSESTIRNYYRITGIEPKATEKHNDLYLKIIEDFKNLESETSIAKKYGVSRQYVSFIIQKERKKKNEKK